MKKVFIFPLIITTCSLHAMYEKNSPTAFGFRHASPKLRTLCVDKVTLHEVLAEDELQAKNTALLDATKDEVKSLKDKLQKACAQKNNAAQHELTKQISRQEDTLKVLEDASHKHPVDFTIISDINSKIDPQEYDQEDFSRGTFDAPFNELDKIPKNIEDTIRNDNLELFKLAINGRRIDQNTFLRIFASALFNNSRDIIKFLLERAENIPQEVLDAMLMDSDYPSHYATIQHLILDGARGEFFERWNNFPLHKAVVENNFEEVRALVEKGSDVNAFASIETSKRSFPFNIWDGREDRLVYEDPVTVRLTPLHLACRYNNSEIAQYLLKKGADSDIPDQDSQTPLHKAAEGNCVEAAKILLNSRASIDFRDNNQKTPLHIASSYGNTELVTLLLENGADLTAQAPKMKTALHLASCSHKTDAVQVLLDKGANIEAMSNDGSTPLHKAVVYNDRKMAELLLKNGANVHARKHNGNTALHIAAERNGVGMAKVLCAWGALANVKNVQQKTPLCLAIEKFQPAMALFLTHHGANLESEHVFEDLHDVYSDELTVAPLSLVRKLLKTTHDDPLELWQEKFSDLEDRREEYRREEYDSEEDSSEEGSSEEDRSESPHAFLIKLLKEYKQHHENSGPETTLLHTCIENGLPNTFACLIENGVDINSPSLLDLAAKSGNRKIINMILRSRSTKHYQQVDITSYFSTRAEAQAKRQAEAEAQKQALMIDSFFAEKDDAANVSLGCGSKTKRLTPESDQDKENSANLHIADNTLDVLQKRSRLNNQ